MTKFTETAAATESLIGSVAAAAVSTSATPEQREAALQYLAAMVKVGHPVNAAPAPVTVAPAPVAAAPAGPPPPPPPAPTTVIPNTPWVAGTLYASVPTSHLHEFGVYDNSESWYAVLKVKTVGITQNHALALQSVVGVSQNVLKCYKTCAAALIAFNHALDIGLVELRVLPQSTPDTADARCPRPPTPSP
ncbi:hypothetical protein B0H13DRAFT_1889472 [Mycena leptocephala]|nr:hypothetical protein B0H13DRAFT_1889472 [Mycena leptocephala]